MSITKEVSGQPVLWCVFSIFLAAASALFGFSLSPGPSGEARYPFFNLLSQVLVQILGSYCTLVPILNQKIKILDHVIINLVFYVAIVASIFSGVLALILFNENPDDRTASNTLKFVADITSAIASALLAAGLVDKGSCLFKMRLPK
ncbi:hypothetical protein F5Y15DRAFT_51782 [Xylariaceae sp. FL0016]|nr:hypothetical protein F5Y15DRAFT_51782 [Xylariaceae sp. FL0016]